MSTLSPASSMLSQCLSFLSDIDISMVCEEGRVNCSVVVCLVCVDEE